MTCRWWHVVVVVSSSSSSASWLPRGGGWPADVTLWWPSETKKKLESFSGQLLCGVLCFLFLISKKEKKSKNFATFYFTLRRNKTSKKTDFSDVKQQNEFCNLWLKTKTLLVTHAKIMSNSYNVSWSSSSLYMCNETMQFNHHSSSPDWCKYTQPRWSHANRVAFGGRMGRVVVDFRDSISSCCASEEFHVMIQLATKTSNKLDSFHSH